MLAKKLLRNSALVGLLAGAESSLAQIPSGLGSSTLRMSWSAEEPVPVPLLTDTALMALGLLLCIIVFRVLKNRPAVVRGLAVLAVGTTSLIAAIGSRELIAQSEFIVLPGIGGSCEGSAVYTSTPITTPPPCFRNTCGVPVAVSYEFIEGFESGEQEQGPALTPENCSFEYACTVSGAAADEFSGLASDGSKVPSNGEPYATAFCAEMFEGIPGSEID